MTPKTINNTPNNPTFLIFL